MLLLQCAPGYVTLLKRVWTLKHMINGDDRPN